MIQQSLIRILSEAVNAASEELGLDPATLPEPELSRPRVKEHGDWATNIALILAPRIGRSPRDVAQAIAGRVPQNGVISSVEVAGPGFINLFLGSAWLVDVLHEILEKGPRFGARPPTGQRIQVEFVSMNPTGPLTVGHARNGVIGDALANVLATAGHEVEREYYFNDGGRQMELFGASVDARYLELHGRPAEIPEGGYHGDYVVDLARDVSERLGDSLLDAPVQERQARMLEEGYKQVLGWIRTTLERFGIRFDTWFSERTLRETGAIAKAVDMLRERGAAYDKDGAIFFRATEYGDEKDRVLIRSNGEPTYFAADCAYLLDKFGRGFDRLVYVWGADHHGTMKRLKGAAQAFGFDPQAVEVILYQLVSLYRAGQPVRMSKRSGELVTLDELLDEVGADAARYTLLTRSPDSPVDFDIEAVTRQSMDNPVYYVQYAHARVASLMRVAEEQGVKVLPWKEADFGTLKEEAELDLIARLSELPEVIEAASTAHAPHRVTRYAEQVAAAFHRFYAEWRVITDDAALTQARLWLAAATGQVIGTALRIIGVSAPESMERIDDQA